MKFKVGDYVKRRKIKENGTSVDNDAWLRDCNREGKNPWRTYKVLSLVHDGDLVLGVDENFGWNPSKFELSKKSTYKPKTPTHLVVWEVEGCGDPCEFFTSEKEAREKIKELSEKTDVVKDSIILVEIKSAQKVNVIKNVRLNQYKIQMIVIKYKNEAVEKFELNKMRIMPGGDALYIGEEERAIRLSDISEIEVSDD